MGKAVAEKFDESIKWLPPFLSEIAMLTSLETALKLVREYGGTRVYIPAHTRRVGEEIYPNKAWKRTKLVKLIGEEHARKISDVHGMCTVDIPVAAALGTKKMKILATTGSARKVAREVGCTERHVRAVWATCGKGR